MKFMSTTCPEKSRGSAIIVAIFVVVVLAALGAFIATISSNQQVGAAYDIQGARVYQGARYGTEWGVYQVLKGACSGGDFCALCQAASYATPTSQNLSGLAGSMSGTTVTVTCGSGAASYSEGASTVWVYQITADACNQPNGSSCPNTTAAVVGSMAYIERRISLTVTN
jgi:MSHA biogenesis protein MshP